MYYYNRDVEETDIGTRQAISGYLTDGNGSPTYFNPGGTVETLNWFYLEDVSGSSNNGYLRWNDTSNVAGPDSVDTSLDGKTWTNVYTKNRAPQKYLEINLTIPSNGKLYIRMNANYLGSQTYNGLGFYFNSFNAGGNIMSLLYGSSFTGTETTFPGNYQYQFAHIFRMDSGYGSGLVSVADLELPATTLTVGCYYYMFAYSNITTGPELPATTLVNNCYSYMYYYCNSIDTVYCNATNPSSSYMYYWLNNDRTGTVVINPNSISNWTRSYSAIPLTWTPSETLTSRSYFYVKNNENNSGTFFIQKSGTSAPSVTIYYSSDKETWTKAGTTSTSALNITLPANGTVYLAATASSYANSSYSNRFKSYRNHDVGGNIASLLYGGEFWNKQTALPSGSHTFHHFFYGDTNLQSASNLWLTATSARDYCYYGMFSGCTSLTSLPTNGMSLTSMSPYCCMQMYYGCTSLTSGAAIQATDCTYTNCLKEMYYNCTSLSYIQTAMSSFSQTANWTYGTPSTGTFYKKRYGGLPSTKNSSGNKSNAMYIPYNWSVYEFS